MTYRLKYSDYSTTASGPPDPAAWVGPPGPPGPPGPMPLGGPFLPLSGGTVTGSINMPTANSNISVWGLGSQVQSRTIWALIDNYLDLTGPSQTALQHGFLFSGNIGGTPATATNVNFISVSSDNVAAPVGSQGVSWLTVAGNFGGSNMRGNRAAAQFSANYVGPNVSPHDGERQWTAVTQTFQANASAGGTAPHVPQSAGYGYAGGDQAWLYSGATNWSGVIGREIDVSIATGASASTRAGLHVVSYGPVQGSDYDFGIGIGGAAANAGFVYAFALGPKCVDPVIGTIFGYQPPVSGITGTEPPPQARRGVDMSQYLFSDSAFRAAGGFVVDPQGAVNVSSAKLSVTAAGQARLDVPGQAITAVAINNGGTNYAAGDLLRGPYGTVLTVSTIGGGGAITGITVNVYGGTTIASPSTTGVHFDGGAGGATATFNLTFTTVGGSLALQPSGGAITSPLLVNAANDAAAASAGVIVGQWYRNGSLMMQRVA